MDTEFWEAVGALTLGLNCVRCRRTTPWRRVDTNPINDGNDYRVQCTLCYDTGIWPVFLWKGMIELGLDYKDACVWAAGRYLKQS